MTKDKDDMKGTHRTSAVGKGMAKSLGFGKKEEKKPTYNYGGYGSGYSGSGYSGSSYSRGSGYSSTNRGSGSSYTPPRQGGFDWDNEDGGWDYPSRGVGNGPSRGATSHPQGAASETRGSSVVNYIELAEPHKTGAMMYDYAAEFSPSDFDREMNVIKDRLLDVLEARGFILPGLTGTQLAGLIADVVEEVGLMKSPAILTADTGQNYVKVKVRGRGPKASYEVEAEENAANEAAADPETGELPNGDLPEAWMLTKGSDWAQVVKDADDAFSVNGMVGGQTQAGVFVGEEEALDFARLILNEGHDEAELVENKL